MTGIQSLLDECIPDLRSLHKHRLSYCNITAQVISVVRTERNITFIRLWDGQEHRFENHDKLFRVDDYMITNTIVPATNGLEHVTPNYYIDVAVYGEWERDAPDRWCGEIILVSNLHVFLPRGSRTISLTLHEGSGGKYRRGIMDIPINSPEYNTVNGRVTDVLKELVALAERRANATAPARSTPTTTAGIPAAAVLVPTVPLGKPSTSRTATLPAYGNRPDTRSPPVVPPPPNPRPSSAQGRNTPMGLPKTAAVRPITSAVPNDTAGPSTSAITQPPEMSSARDLNATRVIPKPKSVVRAAPIISNTVPGPSSSRTERANVNLPRRTVPSKDLRVSPNHWTVGPTEDDLEIGLGPLDFLDSPAAIEPKCNMRSATAEELAAPGIVFVSVESTAVSSTPLKFNNGSVIPDTPPPRPAHVPSKRRVAQTTSKDNIDEPEAKLPIRSSSLRRRVVANVDAKPTVDTPPLRTTSLRRRTPSTADKEQREPTMETPPPRTTSLRKPAGQEPAQSVGSPRKDRTPRKPSRSTSRNLDTIGDKKPQPDEKKPDPPKRALSRIKPELVTPESSTSSSSSRRSRVAHRIDLLTPVHNTDDGSNVNLNEHQSESPRAKRSKVDLSRKPSTSNGRPVRETRSSSNSSNERKPSSAKAASPTRRPRLSVKAEICSPISQRPFTPSGLASILMPSTRSPRRIKNEVVTPVVSTHKPTLSQSLPTSDPHSSALRRSSRITTKKRSFNC